MSRSGYSEDFDQWATIKYRGQVYSALRGRRGQKFLKELIQALDEMPVKRLIAGNLRVDGEVCTLGAIGAKKGVDLERYDPEDSSHQQELAAHFNVAYQMIAEIEWLNDDECYDCTPEERWRMMRRWAEKQLLPEIEIP